MEHHHTARLIPQEGCFVSLVAGKELGIVVDQKTEEDGIKVQVAWGPAGKREWHAPTELRNGFRSGHVVQDSPTSNTRKTLGMGTVMVSQRIADRDLVLVHLHDTGEARWLPYEDLVRLRDARIKYQRGEVTEDDAAERFRLKALAHALDSWNQVTGALDRLDVDPLPHQVDLVHRIMTSDQTNWLVADDVGLGKTIEMGLLLAAMKRRRQARRVLVVCPAGLVRQWQDEMRTKFEEDFFIYGTDFNISIDQPSMWTNYDKVIVSIDRAKMDLHKPIFEDSGDWDLIIFDEAHHLSKMQNRAVTQRYQLAEILRRHTDAFIFLSGTPHQGVTLQFVNLLRLLRPDLTKRLATIYSNPTTVAEMVLRNQKRLAIDANGEFIFRGQDTRRVEAPLSEAAKDFDRQLQQYLRYGYEAADAGGTKGRAIGFVMTIYRKLASSSIAAIERALEHRLARLGGLAARESPDGARGVLADVSDALEEGSDGMDDLEEVSDQMAGSATGVQPFFNDERDHVAKLLEAARQVKAADFKIESFLREIVHPLQLEGQKLLIFTEYRGTQDYLVELLRQRYPNCSVAQINGGMSLNEKRANIQVFNEQAAFMVSTEAGGEGINLHENCHVMVNYDLPWNPARLVQRAGRLYRYGQTKRVIVFNLMADDGFDNRALVMMLDRVYAIARDMASVSSEFGEGFETEVVGELLERVDMASLLAANQQMDMARSDRDVHEAVIRAQEAKTQQERLFSHVEGYDPNVGSTTFSFGPSDSLTFLRGIVKYQGIRIRNTLYDGRVIELELPKELQGRFPEFQSRSVVRVTADRKLSRELARSNAPTTLSTMDFRSSFFSFLIEFAKSPEFKGDFAALYGPASGTLGLYKVRWQNDQGIPREEALLSAFLPEESHIVEKQYKDFDSVLLHPSEACTPLNAFNTNRRQEILELLDQTAQDELASRCTILRHPNNVVLLAVADLVQKP